METLLLKLIVTPLLIGAASLAGAFAMATALALAIQGVSLWAGPVRRPRR
jgi:hypothetical protein